MWPMPTFCRVLIFVPVGNLIVRYPEATRWDISLPSVVVNSNAAAFTSVLRNFLLYLQECGKVERARLQIAPMFFLRLHPFIFLKLLGFVNEEKTRNQTIKDLDSKKVLMREPFWGRKKKSKPNWKHPKSVWSCKMLQLERDTTVEQRCATIPDGGGKENGGGHERWKKSTVAAHFVFFHLWKSFQMMQTVSAAAGCGGSRKKPGPVWLLLHDSKWFRATLHHD